MVWNQASEDLYDSYAKKTGDSGWAWEAIIPLWKKISTFVASLNNPSLSPPPADSSLSNGNGPVQVNFATFATDIDFRVVNSSKELEASSADGMNAGGPIGFGSNQDSAVEGTLSSSATAYLHPALNSRSSLDVLINTQVMKLKETSPLTFTAVEVAQSTDGESSYDFERKVGGCFISRINWYTTDSLAFRNWT
ncbi:hypothetical protein K435DRAFT_862827 [Dendrothele bispora CBS 962.96]|uniref:Uncharacterized protein n=1 Tax=Dendrothele bispora (strain CBS 962.96) TaxID=1314807 RepID=A0A4S8LSY8_DENBC|nr:hypothetical protein K435DRAFT_862827 [Dendrothele bispora CBS 962.96]